MYIKHTDDPKNRHVDRVIAKRSRAKQKTLGIAMVVLLLSVIAALALTQGGQRLQISTERITTGEIRRGAFREFIPVQGIVLPLTTIYLDALEGGQVEEVYVEDGAMLKKDQPILRLANTDLELSLANQETAVFDVLTQMQNTRNNAEQNTIRQLNQMAEVQSALAEAERIHRLNRSLHEQEVISRQEYLSAENNYQYQLRREELTRKTLYQDSVTNHQQLLQLSESRRRMERALELMRRKVDDLIVRAPMGGQLTSLDAETGQSRNKGDRLGQIDVMSGFKVRADIDEHYISRIYTGLAGIFTFAGKDYTLRIRKIYTQVTNGRFQVDFEFDGAAPEGIRRGQTLQIRLTLSDETEAVLLPKGGYYQQTGGAWIFKLSADGTRAYRTDIQVGRQNPEYYEVLAGLQPGDRVIVSSYETYGRMQELILK